MFQMKRVYDAPSKSDGYRVLVDRLWPRGLTKAKVKAEIWMKEVAPSTELRTWYSHDPKKWPEFLKRYKKELAAKPEMLKQLRDLGKEHRTVTLLFGSKEEKLNQAAALLEFLKARK